MLLRHSSNNGCYSRIARSTSIPNNIHATPSLAAQLAATLMQSQANTSQKKKPRSWNPIAAAWLRSRFSAGSAPADPVQSARSPPPCLAVHLAARDFPRSQPRVVVLSPPTSGQNQGFSLETAACCFCFLTSTVVINAVCW